MNVFNIVKPFERTDCMDYEKRLEDSYYNTITEINSEHNVYLVQHRESKKIYVRKVLDVYNPQIYEYLSEHPITGIPKLYNVYEDNGKLILIEEFISGTSLREWIDDKALTLDLMIRIMVELCTILEQLHDLEPPIIHRDVKPSNIIITPCNHVVLIDFNIAKHVTESAEHDTMLLGTKGYAAPEQYGFGSSTPRTDIYAMGILLKELSSSLSVPTNIFDPIIRKCTEMNPSDRMETVQELKIELERLQAPNGERPRSAPTGWKKLIPPGFRTKTPWKMLTALLIYPFLFWLCLTVDIERVSGFHLWIERITILIMMLSIIFCGFDYLGIQRFAPLYTSKHRAMRWLGVLIFNVIILSILFLAMSLSEAIF